MQELSRRKLGGEVEVDETFIGGKARNMHKDRKRRVQKLLAATPEVRPSFSACWSAAGRFVPAWFLIAPSTAFNLSCVAA